MIHTTGTQHSTQTQRTPGYRETVSASAASRMSVFGFVDRGNTEDLTDPRNRYLPAPAGFASSHDMRSISGTEPRKSLCDFSGQSEAAGAQAGVAEAVTDKRPTILRALITYSLMITIPGCVRTSYNLATQQEEYTITSTDKEVEMGRKLARRVESELALLADEAIQERVRTIGERLAAVCDRQELVYTFTVVDDKEVNAFSLPGGYIFVNEGLIKKTASDDELASVIAHEIAHVAARHAVKRYETTLGAQLVQLASLAAARQGSAARGLGIALQAARLAYARQDELDADRLAVRYLKAAGFDPNAMLTFLDRLQEIHHAKIRHLPRGVVRPQYAMTHPFVPDRIRAVKEELFGVADYIDYLNTPQ